MSKSMTKILALAAMAAGVMLTGTRAEAASLPGQNGLRPAVDSLALIETVQVYVFRGRRYCWYDDGWNGAGWYWCGYRRSAGIGWGGGFGFNNWRGGRRGGGTTIIIGMGGMGGPMGMGGPGPMGMGGPGPMGMGGPGPMGMGGMKGP